MQIPEKNMIMIKSVLNEEMDLIIIPNEACNFRCKYCNQVHKPISMCNNDISAIIKFIENRIWDLKKLTIRWFGGEPLLSVRTIEQINKSILEMVSEGNSIYFVSQITTNGYLLDQLTCNRLTDLGISKFQVTLDGVGEEHNKKRKLLNGHGTFDQIWENLIGIKESKIEALFTLRINYTLEEYVKTVDIIKLINETFSSDRRFTVQLRSIEDFENKNVRNISIDKFHILKKAENFFESNLSDKFKRYKKFKQSSNSVCYASSPYSFVIRPNGKINKCTVALNDSVNQVGRLNRTGEIKLSKDLMRLWIRGLFCNDKEWAHCPFPYVSKEYHSKKWKNQSVK